MPRRKAAPTWRFWSKVRFDGPPSERPQATGHCWIWDGATDAQGYGRFRVDSTSSVAAHRWAYEQEHGPIAQDLQADHLCKVTSCVRPSHLEAVTGAVNNARSESPTAKNARKSECPAGHAFDKANTYLTPGGSRHCRACCRERSRERMRRVRAEQRAARTPQTTTSKAA